MSKSRINIILFVLLALSLVGCAKPPTAEMDNAIAAVTRAENDPDAIAYGSSSLARAREALSNMQAEAGAKRYDGAKTYAQEAINAADRAIADGKTGAQRARDEAATLVNGARTALTETEKNITAAKGVKNLGLDFDGISQDFNSAKNLVDQAQGSLSTGNYPDCVSKSQSARSILGNIDTKISQASIATSRKK
ncbi:putative lipoprotein [Treponema primitia ZAS-2]|uniref:Putative lipoprotein n=1 Tax=Treponema primitia (strain ATCC BAA-887 / DSM 12427 / ZAS-2) TaxID=545694 RepID=F5YKE3_TREPZ|nr:DUF4398 domain-containing protein [Treponema primitia]AEF84233.1 putative lipoprotein [Treponema primitia ZAS-2]